MENSILNKWAELWLEGYILGLMVFESCLTQILIMDGLLILVYLWLLPEDFKIIRHIKIQIFLVLFLSFILDILLQ